MYKTRIFIDEQRGASIWEMLLAIAIVAALSPFVYNQIAQTSSEIRDIATAKQIITTRESALNFVRLNQDQWPEYAQIKLNEEELAKITDMAHSAFIDKYMVHGAVITDVYLAFRLYDDALHSAELAKHVGMDAATVDDQGVAYGTGWAVAAPDFEPGDLVYRINYNFSDDDTNKYLHRASSNEEALNVMQRNLDMAKFDISNIGTISAETTKQQDSFAAFAEATNVASASTYFTRGANLDGTSVRFGSMRVTGDITGFRNITAAKLNQDGFSTNGTVIADRAIVSNSVNVGKTLNIKSSSARTISGFAGIVAHSLATPFVSADEMIFSNNFGLVVSGELLMSTMAPLKIGSWTFPSTTPPKFARLELSRAAIPANPETSEFDKLIKTGWKDIPRAKQ